jgi:hypothetical protein
MSSTGLAKTPPVLVLVSALFTLVGVGLLGSGALLYSNTRAFLRDAIEGTGMVIAVDRSRSADGDGFVYYPVIEFTPLDGNQIEFTANVGSNPPAYAVGDSVNLLYRPESPQAARIKDFWSLWLGEIIVVGIGGVFTPIGLGGLATAYGKQRQRADLQKNGVQILTKFHRVSLNTAISLNDRHPFCIFSQWQDPATSEVHLFQSEDLWFDPSDAIPTRGITVLIQPNNPKKYYVPLDFLSNVNEGS